LACRSISHRDITHSPYTTLFRSGESTTHGKADMIISVANLKGGLMRSTNAALLAEAYSRMGKNVAIADTSCDGGAAHWLKLAHQDRKSTRLNSSHVSISYAVFCL